MNTDRASEGTRTLAARALRASTRGEREQPIRLQVLDGPLAGRSLPLDAEETLGRGGTATLGIPDPAASRLHLRLLVENGVVTAEDLRSKNGSLVNKRRLRTTRRLRPGDLLTLGTTRLLLEPAPGTSPVPSLRRRPHLPSPPTALLLALALLLLLMAAAFLLRPG